MTRRPKLARFFTSAPFRILALVLLLVPYLGYIGFTIASDQGPVDYETFMAIGERLRAGEPVYGENSYYPLPYVMIFAAFSALPRALSLALWLGLPVLVALIATRWHPLVLLFAPVLSHFLGGQSVLFALLGVWGYRRQQDVGVAIGGAWLALLTLKPQLGIIPILWAGVQWLRYLWRERKLPPQAIAFIAVTALLYLPSFLVMPDWVGQWLRAPRPLFERALSGFIPRTLLVTLGEQGAAYWLLLVALGGALLALVWWLHRRRLTFDLLLLWSFVVSPLVHDYDLLQLVALLDTPRRRFAAVLLSIPGWLVIATAYNDNSAWFWFTIIAPGLLAVALWEAHQGSASPKSSRPLSTTGTPSAISD